MDLPTMYVLKDKQFLKHTYIRYWEREANMLRAWDHQWSDGENGWS